jgi:hypothetical protein
VSVIDHIRWQCTRRLANWTRRSALIASLGASFCPALTHVNGEPVAFLHYNQHNENRGTQPVMKEPRAMAFEDIIARIQLLLTEMQNQPEDEHELLEQVHAELAQMRSTGQPLPEDLVELEKQLETLLRT